MTSDLAPPQCTAVARQTGERCKRYPIPGGTVCVLHGGGSPKVRAAAARRLEEKRMRAVVEYQATKTGGRVRSIADVYDELLKTTDMALGWRDKMAERIERLDAYGYSSDAGYEQLRTEVALFERAMDRVVSYLATTAKLNLAERAATLSEKQGDLLVGAIQEILDALNLTPEQQARVPEVVPTALRRIVGG